VRLARGQLGGVDLLVVVNVEPDLAARKRSLIGKARQIDHLWRGG